MTFSSALISLAKIIDSAFNYLFTWANKSDTDNYWRETEWTL